MASVGCISVANHNWSYEHAQSEKCQTKKTVKTKKLLNVIDSDGTLESIIAGLQNRFGQTESI